jgi:hypothetical protein
LKEANGEGRMSVIRTYNVEAGLPTLDEARRLVIEEITRARREGVTNTVTVHNTGWLTDGTGYFESGISV